MPKLAIYVPKAEMKLIEKWRKRLNFSQIFMQALQAEIKQQELIKRSAESPKKVDKRLVAAAKFYESQASRAASVEALGLRIGRDQMLDCHIPPPDVPQLVAMAVREVLSDDDIRVIERLTKETPASKIWRQGSASEDRRDLIDRFSRAYLRGVHGAWQEISKHIRNHYKGE